MKKCFKVIFSIVLIMYGEPLWASGNRPPLHPSQHRREKIVNENLPDKKNKPSHIASLTQSMGESSLSSHGKLSVRTDISDSEYQQCHKKYQKFVDKRAEMQETFDENSNF